MFFQANQKVVLPCLVVRLFLTATAQRATHLTMREGLSFKEHEQI